MLITHKNRGTLNTACQFFVRINLIIAMQKQVRKVTHWISKRGMLPNMTMRSATVDQKNRAIAPIAVAKPVLRVFIIGESITTNQFKSKSILKKNVNNVKYLLVIKVNNICIMVILKYLL